MLNFFKNAWKGLKKLILKRGIPELLEATEITIKTVDHGRTKYLDVELMIWDFTLIHRQIPLSEITTSQQGDVVKDIQTIIKSNR